MVQGYERGHIICQDLIDHWIIEGHTIGIDREITLNTILEP